jgi:hypothetical protein
LVSTKRTADPNDSDFVGDDILEKMLVSAKSGACSAGSVPSTQSPKHANKENSKKSTTAPAKKKKRAPAAAESQSTDAESKGSKSVADVVPHEAPMDEKSSKDAEKPVEKVAQSKDQDRKGKSLLTRESEKELDTSSEEDDDTSSSCKN